MNCVIVSLIVIGLGIVVASLMNDDDGDFGMW